MGYVPIGYRTKPLTDARGRVPGHEIAIDARKARIVRRIFVEYVAGKSYGALARELIRDEIPSPRIGSRHKFAGWGSSTIRAILQNERYIPPRSTCTLEYLSATSAARR